eukprot:55753-Ditylum_brightwellii.AAC.1
MMKRWSDAWPLGEVIQSEVLLDMPWLDEEEGYKYLGIMESTDFLTAQVKAKMMKEYISQVRKILDANLTMHNTIMAICAYDVPVMHYIFGVTKWNKGKLATLDAKMCKMLTKHRFHHRCSNTYWLYLSWKKGGQGLTGFVNIHCHKCTTLAECINQLDDPLTKNAEILQVDVDQSTSWLTKAYLGEVVSPLCCLYNKKEESIFHIICNCTPLASTKYLEQHNAVAKYLHWCMLYDRKVLVCKHWWQHKLLQTMIVNHLNITWDYTWDTEGKKIANKPDIVVIEKIAKTEKVIDVAVLHNTNIVATTAEKITNAVGNSFHNYVGQMSPHTHMDTIQKTAVLRTAHILQHILRDSIA